MSQAYLCFDDVSFRYAGATDADSRPALVDVDCAIEEGAFIGVSGPSDAGKTTFCRLLPGFVPHFFDGNLRGSVTVAGSDVTASSIDELGQTIGYVFEDPFDQLTGAATTALEEVAFGLEQAAVPQDEIERRSRDCLDRVGIAALADRDPQTLSGGQLQRLAIASVLALEPDEPTSQLDPVGTDAVFSLAAAMNEEGYTIVFVSQDLQRLAPRVDRLLVFDDGRLRYDDDPRTVFASLDATDATDLVAIPETFRIGRALAERELFDGELPLTVSDLGERARTSDIEPTSASVNGGTVASPSSSLPQSNVVSDSDPNSDELSPLVAGENVSYTYASDTEALRDVTMRMDTGCIAIVGHNGAGKTTLAKHLNGLLTPTKGSVRIAGRDTHEGHVATFARHVGLCFQNPDDQLFRSTVDSEVRFGPEQLGYETARIDELAEEALATLGLVDLREANVYDLGRTLRQRTAIASVVAMDTPAVVLDEPTGGQDARGVAIMGEVVDNLVARGRLVVLITHDIDFAAKHADRVIVLDSGEIVADGPPVDVFRSERSVLDRAGVAPPVATRAGAALGLDEVVLSPEELLSILDG